MVWAGDVVSLADVPTTFMKPSIWAYGLVVVTGAAGGIFFWNNQDTSCVILSLVSALCLAVTLYLEFAWSRMHGRSRARAMGGKTFGQLAVACFIAATREPAAGKAAAFDAKTWIERTGSHGPRVITFKVVLAPIFPAQDIAEVVDIGINRNIGRVERRRLLLALMGLIPLLALAGLTFRFASWNPGVLLGQVTWVAVVAVAAYRLGFRPIELPSVIASPGRVTFSVPPVEFERGSSVLLLIGRSNVIEAWFVRADGYSKLIRYMPDPDEPGLRGLIDRWCWRDGCAASWEGPVSLEAAALPMP